MSEIIHISTEEFDLLRQNAEMDEEILAEIAGTLKELGCDCGPDAHLSTPPMFYREWMLCVMGSAIRSATRDLEAQNNGLARDFAEFRRDIRSKLWPFWPSNVGVSDDEVIDAVERCVSERRDLEAQVRELDAKLTKRELETMQWIEGFARATTQRDHLLMYLHEVEHDGDMEGCRPCLTWPDEPTATPPSPEVGA